MNDSTPRHRADAAEGADMDAYERACEAEDRLSRLDTTTSQIDLLNVIRMIVDDVDDLTEEAHRDLIRKAYNHFVANGGVDYDTAVGKLLFDTVRDAVTDAMHAAGFMPEED
jgi:hypothetical protein